MMQRCAVLLLLLTLVPFISHAQAIRAHPPSIDEFSGYWRVIPLEVSRQPPALRATPLFQGDCQFFVHSDDRRWDHVQIESLGGEKATAATCETTTRAQLAQHISTFAPKQVYAWTPIVERRGFFWTADTGKRRSLLWRVSLVDEEFDASSHFGIYIKQGDLVMQLFSPQTNSVVWWVFLRRVSE